jgi:hypothetical protein
MCDVMSVAFNLVADLATRVAELTGTTALEVVEQMRADLVAATLPREDWDW